MSIINKMLQDLDRRQGMSDPETAPSLSQVRTVAPARKDREWFWRIIAVLMIAAVGWVGWIAWQLQPRPPVATEQAFKAAENAQRRTVAIAPPAAPAAAARAETKRAEERPPAQEPAPTPVAAQPAAVATPAPPPAAESLKLAQDMHTPIREQPAKPAAKDAPAPAPKNAGASRAKDAGKQDAAVAEAKPAPERAPVKPAPLAQSAPKFEKRERMRTPQERAEADFRRGVALLNQGRISEAEDDLGSALRAYAGHESARQALVALDLEQGRVDNARRLLQEGLALNPANVRFSAVLARILIERKDYQGALDATGGALEQGQGDAELQAMRGTALQRLGRNAEASEAFRASLRAAPQNGSTWMALAISLEGQGKRPEAAEAYRRAAAAGSLGADARTYAEQRARALQ